MGSMGAFGGGQKSRAVGRQDSCRQYARRRGPRGVASLRGGFKRERGVGASTGSGSQPRGQRALETLQRKTTLASSEYLSSSPAVATCASPTGVVTWRPQSNCHSIYHDAHRCQEKYVLPFSPGKQEGGGERERHNHDRGVRRLRSPHRSVRNRSAWRMSKAFVRCRRDHQVMSHIPNGAGASMVSM